MASSVVHIVHAIDTEGPLHEDLPALFEWMQEVYGVGIEPTLENLFRLSRSEIDLGGREIAVAQAIEPRLRGGGYNDSWDKIDRMVAELTSPASRNELPDSFGGGWVYNWHCVDHVGFDYNPRRRDTGFHIVFDRYQSLVGGASGQPDGVHFHHHPVPFSREAHRSATHYFAHLPIVFEILARRVIDRLWFPCVNRPGFHTIRPDSHWFLEQHIPFDLASQATDEDYSGQPDLSEGRFGDWRRAPRSWTPYHPDHDDYQRPGRCRRWVGRCLNMGGRMRVLRERDVDLAFQEAAKGQPVVLSFTDHDYADMRSDLKRIKRMIHDAAGRHPGVPFRYCEARQAMRSALAIPDRPPIGFALRLDGNRMRVRADAPTFGPQPFLAIRSRDGRYVHDNLDFQENFRDWTYTFDDCTFPLDRVEAVGVAACDETGNVTVAVLNPQTGQVEQSQR